MEYTIIMNTNPKEFVKIVNKAIEKGWSPQGGIATPVKAGQEDDIIYVQAMVK